MEINEIIQSAHDRLVRRDDSGTSYAVINDFSGTYIGKQMEKEERMISPIFRVFEAAKPDRSRKVNVDPRHRFDPYSDSLLDYGSIIGSRLKKPWQQFNRLLSVHVPYCPNRCWHCYLPKELFTFSTNSRDRIEYVKSGQIVDRFLQQREADRRQNRESNILRITGGEPFLIPEMILECLTEIRKRGLENDVFVWTETNLLPFIGKKGEAFMDGPETGQILLDLGSFKNFAVHPCFHGLDAGEFDAITGTSFSVTLEQQAEGIRRLLSANIHVYPTFGSNVCKPSNIPKLFEKMIAVSPDLPLKLALVKYDTDYEPITHRIQANSSDPQLYSHYSALRIWNQLLLGHYGVGYGILPRHTIRLGKAPSLQVLSSPCAVDAARAIQKTIFLFKSSFRQLYHREILEYLAYPINHIIEINYEKRHVQKDLFWHMSQCPGAYRGSGVIWCYADDPNKTRLPFRLARICDVSERGGVLAMKLRLEEFVSFDDVNNADLPGTVTRAFMEYFGEKTLEPNHNYMLLGEYPFDDYPSVGNTKETRLSHDVGSCVGQVSLGYDDRVFTEIIPHLIPAEKMKTSVFYRIETDGLNQTEKDDCTSYQVKGGNSFRIDLHSFLPNYDNFDEKTPAKRTIVAELSSSIIAPTGPTQIVCSKYGRESFSFKTEKVTEKKEVRLTFRCLDDQFSAARVELRIIVLPQNWKAVALSTLGALGIFLVTSAFAALDKAILTTTKGESVKSPLEVIASNVCQLWAYCTSSLRVGAESLLVLVIAIALLFGLFRLNLAGLKAKPQ